MNAKRELPAAAPTRPRVRLPLGVGRFLLLIAFTASMTALGIYQVHRQHELVMVGYAIDEALFEHRRLQEAQKRLELSLSTYKDPDVVRTFAEDALDMRVPTPADELFVPGDDAVLPIAPAPPAGRDVAP